MTLRLPFSWTKRRLSRYCEVVSIAGFGEGRGRGRAMKRGQDLFELGLSLRHGKEGSVGGGRSVCWELELESFGDVWRWWRCRVGQGLGDG